MQKEGINVIRLDIGSPDLPPADFVIEKLAKSAHNANHHGYSGYSGIPSYRQAVAAYYEQRFGVHVDADKEVLPILGSKEGIVNLSLAYLDRGDVSLVPDISYPSYAMGAYLAGAEVHWLACTPENHFRPNLDNIPADVLRRAKLLWINFPNNPTGEVVQLAYYEEVLAFCRTHDILLVSDNPYADVTFDGYVAPSPLQLSGAKDHTLEFMSHSKTHNMAGWRLGAAVGSATAIKHLLNVKSNIDSGHFIPIYEAGALALSQTPDAWLDERNAVYARRRDLVMSGLESIGLRANTPKGTLYIWAKVLEMDATQYVERALQEAHVSFAPGLTYGPGGKGYLRISLSVSDTQIEEALQRLSQWYGKL
jgi:LL-diaminopimelate aminotransferase